MCKCGRECVRQSANTIIIFLRKAWAQFSVSSDDLKWLRMSAGHDRCNAAVIFAKNMNIFLESPIEMAAHFGSSHSKIKANAIRFTAINFCWKCYTHECVWMFPRVVDRSAAFRWFIDIFDSCEFANSLANITGRLVNTQSTTQRLYLPFIGRMIGVCARDVRLRQPR